jgi:diguanylate cyclase (GGDEF)-like protein
MKSADLFESIFETSENLPTLPGIALRLLQAVQKQNPDIDEIGKILATDPPLSAKVLKIVNSSFYSLPSRITSVNHAINMLGINSVKNLALGFSLVNKFNSTLSKSLDPSLFWKDSLVGAIAVKLIGEKIIKSFSDDIFFLGLLQNIGFFTLSCCMPKQYDLVMVQFHKNTAQVHEVESQILGFNHMEIGEYLIKSWVLPETFYTPIGYHHYPQRLKSARDDIHTLTKVLHLSSLYIELFNHSSDVGLQMATIEQRVKAYGFDETIDIHEVGKAINQQASEVFPIFEIDFKDENEYAQLLETAKAELINLSTELMNNLSDQRQEINLLRQQVGLDSMTNLNNHQRFKELLQKEISRSDRYNNPLSIIFADIDHFKSINDTYGHIAGDRVIKIVAGCLKKELRESEHLARYGGEEFAVILPETEKEDAWMVAERLRKTIDSLRIAHGDGFIHPTMSFGIAPLKPGEKISLDESIRRADSALYNAKNQGRNQCCLFDIRNCGRQ